MKSSWPAPVKAALVVFLSLLCSCRNAHDGARHDVAGFASVYHASKALAAAIHSGTDYPTFSSLVQGYATEVEVAKDATKSDDARELLRLYSDGLSKYTESRKFWSIAIDCETQPYLETHGYLNLAACERRNEELQHIVAAHKFSLVEGYVNISEALSTMWHSAEIPIDKANALYISWKS